MDMVWWQSFQSLVSTNKWMLLTAVHNRKGGDHNTYKTVRFSNKYKSVHVMSEGSLYKKSWSTNLCTQVCVRACVCACVRACVRACVQGARNVHSAATAWYKKILFFSLLLHYWKADKSLIERKIPTYGMRAGNNDLAVHRNSTQTHQTGERETCFLRERHHSP